jgi:hypothetical protein
MAAADSTDVLDHILKDYNTNILPRLQALGPRAAWVDRSGQRWTLPTYISACVLLQEFSPATNPWLEAAIQWRTQQPVPSNPTALHTYRRDLVWLWAASAMGSSTPMKLNNPALLLLQKAMQDPDLGPGFAGWGVRGEGWLAEALQIPARLIKHIAGYEERYRHIPLSPTDRHHSPTISPARLLTWLLHGNPLAPQPFLFEPNADLVPASDLSSMAFSPRSRTQTELPNVFVPRDIQDHLGTFTRAVIEASLNLDSDGPAGRAADFEAFWSNLPHATVVPLLSAIFSHLAEHLGQAGAGATPEPLKLGASLEQWLSFSVPALADHREVLLQPNTGYVVGLIANGEVVPSRPSAALDEAVTMLQNLWKEQTLDTTLPKAFGSSLRSTPRF